MLATLASGASPSYSLILTPRVALETLANIATNAFYTPVSGAIGDLNGDGAPDIVIGINGGPPAVYLNNLTATPFQNVPGALVAPPPGPNSSGLGWGGATIVDVNADGHPDLAIAGFNGPNRIYLNDGSSTPFTSGASVNVGALDVSYFPAFGDVNGDGFPDLLVANTNHVPSRLYLTRGAPLTSGAVTTAQIGTDLGYGGDARIADVNGDGKADVILTYTYATVGTSDPTGIAIYLNNGSSDPFGSVAPIRLMQGHYVQVAVPGDLNGDGRLDLAVAVLDQPAAKDIQYVFLNTGSASQPFGTPQALQLDTELGGGCLSAAIGDANGDGLPDVLLSCLAPAYNMVPAPTIRAAGAIYLNNGTANPFSGVVPISIPATASSGYGRGVAIGKFVASGPADVLIVDEATPYGSYFPATLDQNPTTQNDSAVCAISKSVVINPLANDSAGPAQTLNVASLTVTVAPLHGSATINATTGAVTYLPANGYTGTDSFEYTVRDGLGAKSNVAVVSINVQPAPVAVNETATVAANQSIVLSVLSNDTSAGGTLNAASIQITVAPAHGTAVITNGAVTYTPTNGFSGLDTFQYSVQDNLGTTSNVATTSIEVSAPSASSGSSGGGGAMGVMDLAAFALLGWRLVTARRRRSCH